MEKEKKYTPEDLREMQAWPLERKIRVAQTRIIEWYQHYDGKVYVSFSGGKDSTVLLDMARRIYPDIEAVFIDTGLEYPEIREFVKTFDNITWLKPKMNFRQVIEKYGYPLGTKHTAQLIEDLRKGNDYVRRYSDPTHPAYRRSKFNLGRRWVDWANSPENDHIKVSKQCCNVMKKSTAHRFHTASKKHPIIATMAEEGVMRRQAWLVNGCNAFEVKHPQSQPMSFWTEQDVLLYLKRFNVPYASVYGEIVEDDKGKLHTTGCARTGCVFCAFGAHLEKEPNRFQRLKQTHPKLWEYCMKPWNEGGLGMKEVLESIGVKIE